MIKFCYNVVLTWLKCAAFGGSIILLAVDVMVYLHNFYLFSFNLLQQAIHTRSYHRHTILAAKLV